MLTIYRPFHRLDRDLDRFLASALRAGHRPEFTPSIDVEEHEHLFVLRADLPGIKQEDLSIEVSDSWLTLRGERVSESSSEEHDTPVQERHFGAFARRFRLGIRIEVDNIEASYRDGVLTVKLPKKVERIPRQVPIQHH